MGNVYSSFSSYTFDTIQHKIMCNYDFVLISTLPDSEQGCLIKKLCKYVFFNLSLFVERLVLNAYYCQFIMHKLGKKK